MMYYFQVGGPLMWILLVLSIISTTVILERLFFFFKSEKSLNRNFRRDIVLAVSNKDMCKIVELCDKEKNAVGCSIKQFVCRGDICSPIPKEFHKYEQLIKEIQMDEISPLEKRLHILGIIAHIAPMLGLLGTVTGMIDAFKDLSQFGAGDPTLVADSISKTLITTAAGLSIAIPALVVYNLLTKKIEEIEEEIDKITTNVINIVRG